MALCWIRCGISPFWRSIRQVQCGVRIWCHAWWPVLVLLPASNEILPRSLSHMCAPSLSVKSFQDQKSYMKFRSICESFGHFKARARGICSALMEQHLQGPMVDGGAFHRPMWGQKIVIWMDCYQLQLRGGAGSLQEPSARLCHGWQARLESMAKQHRGNLCQRDILQSLSQVPAVSGAWNQGLWVEFRGRKPKAKSAGATFCIWTTQLGGTTALMRKAVGCFKSRPEMWGDVRSRVKIGLCFQQLLPQQFPAKASQALFWIFNPPRVSAGRPRSRFSINATTHLMYIYAVPIRTCRRHGHRWSWGPVQLLLSFQPVVIDYRQSCCQVCHIYYSASCEAEAEGCQARGRTMRRWRGSLCSCEVQNMSNSNSLHLRQN